MFDFQALDLQATDSQEPHSIPPEPLAVLVYTGTVTLSSACLSVIGLLIWVALVGCLVHARYDFPFQIYSILFLFLTICALLFNLSRRPW